MRTFWRIVWGPADILLTLVFSVAAVAIAFVILVTRGQRDTRRILSIAPAPVFVAQGDDVGLFSTYYLYSQSSLSAVVFLDGRPPDAFVGRSLRSLIGVTFVDSIPSAIRKVVPLSAAMAHEIVSIVRLAHIARRLQIGAIATLSPSRVMFRAFIASRLLGTSLILKVFGNQALLAHIKNSRSKGVSRSISNLIFDFIAAVVSQVSYRTADLVIGYNINNAASAISFGANPSRTRMLRIRPHAATLQIQPASSKMNGQIVLWSRLSPEKAVYEGCKAALQVLDRHAKATLLIIGDGPERSRLEQLVNSTAVSSRVEFAGWLARDELLARVNGSSIALIPLGGYSLLEAAMLEIPIVCFDIEWHNEVISHGETGFLADYPDIEHMAGLILELLTKPDMARGFASAARRRVQTMFEPQRRADDESRIMTSFFGKTSERI